MPFALFYLDMNNFKEVNDSYSHDEGDKLLIEVARRIKSCICEADIAARVGGDEFTITLTSDETEGYCLELQEKLRQCISKPYMIKGTVFYSSISVGFARYPYDAQDIKQIMRLADQRMYEEK